MKVGVRKPSVNRRIKARTTGRLKRSVKRSVIPYYGKKGTGIIKDPKKAIYNKVYNHTTVGVDDIFAAGMAMANSTSSKKSNKNYFSETISASTFEEVKKSRIYGKIFMITSILFFVFAALGLLTEVYSIMALGLIAGFFSWYQSRKYKANAIAIMTAINESELQASVTDESEESSPDVHIEIE